MDALLQLQDDLEAGEPLAYRIPSVALHLTVQPVVDPAPGGAAHDLWLRDGDPLASELAAACQGVGGFTVRFHEVRRVGAAVILWAEPDGALQAVRTALFEACRRRGIEARRPAIAHITLFRSLADSAPRGDQTLRAVDVAMEVSEVRLVHERIYPSLDVEVLRTLPLGGGAS